MPAPIAAVIDSLNEKIAQLRSELGETLERAVTAERQWAAALNREREALDKAEAAETELAWLRKELSEEAQ